MEAFPGRLASLPPLQIARSITISGMTWSASFLVGSHRVPATERSSSAPGMEVDHGRMRIVVSQRPSVQLLLVATAAIMAPPVQAQELRGRVLELGNERTIPHAIVQLIDKNQHIAATAFSDSIGTYVLRHFQAGEYRIRVEALGYEVLESHLLLIGDHHEHLRVDLELRKVPLALPGLVVPGERSQEIERRLRLLLGVNPRSLRHEIITRPTIDGHLARSHNVVDLIRWSNLVGFTVLTTERGPCFRWRQHTCLPVFLNGARIVTGHSKCTRGGRFKVYHPGAAGVRR